MPSEQPWLRRETAKGGRAHTRVAGQSEEVHMRDADESRLCGCRGFISPPGAHSWAEPRCGPGAR